jgi:hypothetical protein
MLNFVAFCTEEELFTSNFGTNFKTRAQLFTGLQDLSTAGTAQLSMSVHPWWAQT